MITVIVEMTHLSCNELLGTVRELFSLGQTRKPTQFLHIPNQQEVIHFLHFGYTPLGIIIDMSSSTTVTNIMWQEKYNSE